jgi:Kef-type K+ transport system membrane component KefB
MNSTLIFLVQALVLVALPVVVLRFSGLKGRIPLVVVQIVVGIALGPSLFGRLEPDLYELFFNPTALAPLSGISSVAIVIFGLITGLHFDAAIFRNSGRATSIIAAANIAVPIALGCLGGFWILARHPGELVPGISPSSFVLSIGICTAVTALPVLAAILREMNLLGHRISDLALAIAGIKDLSLYILLALLLTTVAARAAGGLGILVTVALVPIYLVVMLRVVRPLLGRMVTARMQDGEVRERALVLVGVVTIASALAVEAMGLSNILGAFVAGAVMPPNLRKPILDRLQAPTLALLMPFFFTITGLRTLIDPGSSAFLEVFIVSPLISVIGIVGGTAIAARFVGESWPFALGLGALLQTKGLMEIVVLTILLDARIISANVFAALILMAVVSTALAMPLGRLMLRQENKQPRSDQKTRAAGTTAIIEDMPPVALPEQQLRHS